jgi:hypothetical protein
MQISFDQIKQYVQIDVQLRNMPEELTRVFNIINEYKLIPALGIQLKNALSDSKLALIQLFEVGNTAIVGNYYAFDNKYYKCLTQTTSTPIQAPNSYQVSQMAYLYAKKIVPYLAFSAEYELLKTANVIHQASSLVSVEAGQAVQAVERLMQQRKALAADNMAMALTGIYAQVREWNNTIDGTLYRLPTGYNGVGNFECCNQCTYRCVDSCRRTDNGRNSMVSYITGKIQRA